MLWCHHVLRAGGQEELDRSPPNPLRGGERLQNRQTGLCDRAGGQVADPRRAVQGGECRVRNLIQRQHLGPANLDVPGTCLHGLHDHLCQIRAVNRVQSHLPVAHQPNPTPPCRHVKDLCQVRKIASGSDHQTVDGLGV